MKFPIGFTFNEAPEKQVPDVLAPRVVVPVESLAQVYFPERNQEYSIENRVVYICVENSHETGSFVLP